MQDFTHEKEPMKTMISVDTILGIIFLCQFGIGCIGNTWLLMLHIKTFQFWHYKKKPIDLIVIHLTLANILTIAFSGLPDILFFFGIRDFLVDMGCKVVLYLYRVSRGLSLFTTTILSVYQALTITPSNSTWSRVKSRLSWYILLAFFFSWIINLLIYNYAILAPMDPFNITTVGYVYTVKYAKADSKKAQLVAFQVGLISSDVLCVSLMIWTSWYMVKLLFSHHKLIHHVHSTSLYPRIYAEIKATHSILALVSCFVLFYCTNCCIDIYVSNAYPEPALENMTRFISSCYSAICPFLLIKNKSGILSLNCAFLNIRKPLHKLSF